MRDNLRTRDLFYQFDDLAAGPDEALKNC